MEPAAAEAVSATYQVFINHRGADVKKKLASLIYRDLNLRGLRVFLDEKELCPGDTISLAIRRAIFDTASVHIAIFSENYAQSHWCLDELCWILKSVDEGKSKLVPVFYDVEPSDIRNFESGHYAEAFQRHESKGRVCAEWKTAITRASQISGLLFSTNNSDHGKVLGEIVDAVLEKVKLEALEVARFPVGLEQAVEDFQNKIMKQSKLNGAAVVGIVGIDGLGKSTLAKHLYNLKRSDFSRSCFLSEVREKDLLSLQRQLLRDLLLNFRIDDTSHGKGIFRQYLRGLRALVVLDDVDHVTQINSLVVPEVMATDSLILITSRDQDLLKRSTALYHVKPLQGKHAQELFCSHAFGQSQPWEGFENLVEEFLKICGGVPLVLEVLGAQLWQPVPDRIYWQRKLKKFSNSLPRDIINTLKESYECLNNTEKDMFLDIACFFVGEARELAIRVLEGLGNKDAFDSLDSLRQKCLLEYRYDVHCDENIECRTEEPSTGRDYENLYLPPSKETYIITMHNHVREFARNIAREELRVLQTPKLPLRLSGSNDVEEMLQAGAGADSCCIRGIRIRIPKGQNFPDCTNYIKVVGLQLLVLEGPIDLSSLFRLWNIEGYLVWLRLLNFRSIYFPDTISLAKLRVLEIKGHGDLKELFHRFEKPPWYLRVLDIDVTDTGPSTSSGRRSSDLEHSKGKNMNSDSAQQGETASSLSHFLGYIGASTKFLSKIALKNIEYLESLPIDFSKLKSLRHLDLSGCTNLTQLPKSFSELIHLQYLALRDCINLAIPTDILGKISSLEYVDFKGCGELVELPLGIASQSRLRYLNLLYTRLREIPSSLGALHELERLRIGSTELRELRHSVGHLMGLQELIMVECSGLDRILPKEIAGPNIKVLVIRGCPIDNFSFEDQGMDILRDFSLKNTFISEICIPEGVFPSLETVDLSENTRLTQVKGLPSTLLRLHLEKCTGLKTLTNLSNLRNLKFLDISECPALETLNVEGLTSLEEIKAEACWELKKLEGLSLLERLNCLHISTDNRLIWNNIGEYLASVSHRGKVSTASFSGMADFKRKRILDGAEMRCIMKRFNIKMVDILSSTRTTSGFNAKLENIHSHSAILMCFITSAASPRHIRVRFEACNYGGPTQEYRSLRGNGVGRSLHVFMWTEDSDLFKDYREYSDIDVYCSDICVSELDTGPVESGWMVMVNNNAHVWEVCREFITAFA